MSIAVLQATNKMQPNKLMDLRNILNDCENFGIPETWLIFNLVILIGGLLANILLLWLFLRDRKSFSASKVLGVNLLAMNLLYLLMYPLFVYSDILEINSHQNKTDDIITKLSDTHGLLDAIYSFHVTGCPLLLACMCVERYLAVAKPVLYQRLSRRDCNLAISAVMWTLALGACVLTAVKNGLNDLLLSFAIITSFLFLLMVASLGGVVWELWKPSPTHTIHNNSGSSSQAPPPPSLKRKAVKNVLAVMVPAVVSYLPILSLAPYISYMRSNKLHLNPTNCEIFNWILLIPNTGVLIGPTFYLAKARQVLCRRVDNG